MRSFQPEELERWPQTAAHRLKSGLWLEMSRSELITIMQRSCVAECSSRDSHFQFVPYLYEFAWLARIAFLTPSGQGWLTRAHERCCACKPNHIRRDGSCCNGCRHRPLPQFSNPRPNAVAAQHTGSVPVRSYISLCYRPSDKWGDRRRSTQGPSPSRYAPHILHDYHYSVGPCYHRFSQGKPHCQLSRVSLHYTETKEA